MSVLPFSPLLVVIRMTPLAPRTPKTAVADASFRIDIDATSLASIVRILSRGTPSIKTSGLFPFKVAAPRRYIRSEEHTSELQSLMRISYAVFCLTKTHTPYFTNHLATRQP